MEAAAYKIPTDYPESDGTLQWDSTTIVVAEARSGGHTGLGFTYAHASVANLIWSKLASVVVGEDAMAVPARWSDMQGAIRNLGHTGLTQMAIAAVDVALWDLKAHLLGIPMVTLLGQWRERVPVYGSGGFTSYPIDKLQAQLAGWVEAGIPRVKMKVGRDPAQDESRVRFAREAIGEAAELYVDANGAYDLKQALEWARRFADLGATWLEEPVTSDDLTGLRLIREQAPAGMDIAAGEYGFELDYFERMLAVGAIDVIQPDVTRCGGFTGFLQVGAVCQAHHVPLSAHTAPQLDAHVCACVAPLRHIEYFHDHVRVEQVLFEGALVPGEGSLVPDRSRSGLGLEMKHADAGRWMVEASPRWRSNASGKGGS